MHADTPNMKKPTGSNELPAGHADTGEFTLAVVKSEPRADSRLIAKRLGIKHKNVFEQVKNHRADFAQFGKVPFQTEALPSGQSEKYAMLNEDQAYLLLSYSRNTARVRDLKVKMVQAFGSARRAAQVRQQDYLPAYHALHEHLQGLGRDDAHQRHLHVNVNRLLNKLAGIEAGERPRAGVPVQSILTVGQMLAARAIAGAQDERDAYQRIKAALIPLGALPVVEVLQ